MSMMRFRDYFVCFNDILLPELMRLLSCHHIHNRYNSLISNYPFLSQKQYPIDLDAVLSPFFLIP